MIEKPKNRKTTLVLTYNHVKGYPQGVYKKGNNKVIVHSQDRRYYQDSPSRLSELMHSLYSKVDFDKIDEVVVYSGLNAMEGSLRAAKQFSHNNKKIKLVACSCDYGEKKRVARELGVELIGCSCGGVSTLGSLVDSILEGE